MKIGLVGDTQAKEGVLSDHMEALGNYYLDKRPEVILFLGDHFDMPSLSSYDQGKKSFEGRTYVSDIEAGQESLLRFLDVIYAHQRKMKRQKRRGYTPELVYLLGNHEQRIERAIEVDRKLEGLIGYHNLGLEPMGFQVQNFLEIYNLCGIAFSHFFTTPGSSRAIGGTAVYKLNKLKHSFVMGHQQGYDITPPNYLTNGSVIRGGVFGSFYLHEEKYQGPQGNQHYRGTGMLTEVDNGYFNVVELSCDYLIKRWL